MMLKFDALYAFVRNHCERVEMIAIKAMSNQTCRVVGKIKGGKRKESDSGALISGAKTKSMAGSREPTPTKESTMMRES